MRRQRFDVEVFGGYGACGLIRATVRIIPLVWLGSCGKDFIAGFPVDQALLGVGGDIINLHGGREVGHALVIRRQWRLVSLDRENGERRPASDCRQQPPVSRPLAHL